MGGAIMGDVYFFCFCGFFSIFYNKLYCFYNQKKMVQKYGFNIVIYPMITFEPNIKMG